MAERAAQFERESNQYLKVFQSVKAKVLNLRVEWVMLDFEAAMWQALREVLPNTVIKGCGFHWNQRIYRKITTLGLTTAYHEKGDKHRYMRKLMSLPYLPSEQIVGAFEILEQQAADVGGPLQDLTNYMRRTWIAGSVWKVDNWGLFRETVRTNNDVEGWHHRINSRAGKSDLGFYVLVPLLKKEAEVVDIQIRLVSDNLLTRLHRKKYATIHGRLFTAWDRYEDDETTTTQLLREVSNIAGLGPIDSRDAIHDDEN